MKANKKTLNEFYRLSGIKPINEESNSSTSTSQISSEIKKEMPNLIKDPNIEKIANEILKDPKAIEALKQFVSMGKTNENNESPTIDNSFLDDAINMGIKKVSSLNEFKREYEYSQGDGESSTEKNPKDMGGKIGGVVGAMVGGAYLADKLVPNPMVMGKIATNIGYVNDMMLQNDPMVIAALGALAGAVIAAVAYKVFNKKKKNVNEVLGILGDGPAPLFKENGVAIYDIGDVETAIELGGDTNWAISQPGNQMFRAYIEKGYKVFFVFDENKSGSPLEKVGIMVSEEFDKEPMVVDKNDSQHNFNTYMSYLKSVGVPIQMLK